MATPTAVSAEPNGSWLVSLAIAVLVGLAIALSYVLFGPTADLAKFQARSAQKVLAQTGLNRPVLNKLDSRYVDTNGDRLADTPADGLIDPQVLKFSYIAVEDPSAYQQQFADLLTAISQTTGRPVEYVPYTNTDEQLKALRDGKLHIAGLSTGTVPIAVDSAGFIPFAQLGNAQKAVGYSMKIIVPADSSYKRLADIKGGELTLTQPNSHSGGKAPLVLLRDEGLTVGPDYNIRYSGGHEQSIRGIEDGTYAVAAVASDYLLRSVQAGLIRGDQYREIYSSPEFPPAAIGTVYNLQPDLAAKIQKAVLAFNFKNTTLEKPFAASAQNSFKPVNYVLDWHWVRKVDDEIGYTHQLK